MFLNGLGALVLIVCTTTDVRLKTIGNAANASTLSFTTSTISFALAPVSAVLTLEDLPAPFEVVLFVVYISGSVLLYLV